MTEYRYSTTKKIYDSPNYVNSRGTHYVLEEGTVHNSTHTPHNEYVIVLDSASKRGGYHQADHKAHEEFVESNDYHEKDAFYHHKFTEFERSHNIEIEEIKQKIMNECKIILVNIYL